MADLVLLLLGGGVDPVHPLLAGLLLSGTGLGKHLLLPGGGLDPVPLLAFTILLSVALICLLPWNGLDPVLSLAGFILLPGADLLLVFVLQWDLGLVHALVGTILLPRADTIPLPDPRLADLSLLAVWLLGHVEPLHLLGASLLVILLLDAIEPLHLVWQASWAPWASSSNWLHISASPELSCCSCTWGSSPTGLSSKTSPADTLAHGLFTLAQVWSSTICLLKLSFAFTWNLAICWRFKSTGPLTWGSSPACSLSQIPFQIASSLLSILSQATLAVTLGHILILSKC